MKITITIILTFLLSQVYGQDNSGYRIIRSNLGSGGSSQTIQTSNGNYKVSQSIGQSSVIGTYSHNGYVLRQGYQQPISEKRVIRELNSKLDAKVYPNPFNQYITISFSDSVSEAIEVSIFNVEGRAILNKEFLPSQKVEIQIQDIASGVYFLKVTSGLKHFDTKLIKI